MLKTIEELITILKETNFSSSLAIKTTNTTTKNNDNITELAIKQILLDNGLHEQQKTNPTIDDLQQEYTRQTGKIYYKLSSKEGKALTEMEKAEQIKKLTQIKTTYKTPLKNGYFMYQPNGSQMPPDFAVNINGFLDIESKAGHLTMFNSGLPKENTFYMCEFLDGTSHRDFGKNIFAEPAMCNLLKEIREEFEEHNDNALNRLENSGKFSNEKLEIIKKYNLCLYPRAMMRPFSAKDSIWNITI